MKTYFVGLSLLFTSCSFLAMPAQCKLFRVPQSDQARGTTPTAAMAP